MIFLRQIYKPVVTVWTPVVTVTPFQDVRFHVLFGGCWFEWHDVGLVQE